MCETLGLNVPISPRVGGGTPGGGGATVGGTGGSITINGIPVTIGPDGSIRGPGGIEVPGTIGTGLLGGGGLDPFNFYGGGGLGIGDDPFGRSIFFAN